MNDGAQILVTSDASSVVIKGHGTLDITNSDKFGEELKQASLTADNVTVDLCDVDFIDTQVVQFLAKTAVTLLKRDKRLKVVVLKKAYVLRVLRISGFEVIMDIEAMPESSPA